MEESKPMLETEVAERIDLADLIEREQIKRVAALKIRKLDGVRSTITMIVTESV
jgi:hypothetical protein